MIRTTNIERHLEGSALSWTVIGGVAAGSSLAAGIVGLSAPCAFAENEASCDPRVAQAMGGVLIGVGAALAVPVIVAIAQSKDGVETTVTKDRETPVGEAEVCNVEPGDNVIVEMTAAFHPDLKVKARTGEDGRARFSLAAVRWKPKLDNEHLSFRALGGGSAPAMVAVSVEGLAAYDAFLYQNAAEREQRRSAALARKALLKEAVRKVDEWTAQAVKVKWTSSEYTRKRCFNRVDEEVPCGGDAAHRKEELNAVVTQATIANHSKLALTCGQFRGSFGTGASAEHLAPGKTVQLQAIEPLFGFLLGTGSRAVSCTVSTEQLSQAVGQDLAPITSGKDIALLVLMSGTRFVHGLGQSEPVYNWDRSEVVTQTR